MSKQDIEKRLGFAAQGVKATFAEFNVGDKVVATPNNHIDAYGRIIKIENGIATIASAEGNVKAKLSDLELVKKGSVEDLRRLGMKGFARPGVKAKMAAPANWESKLDAKNLADSFNVEGLRELLGSAKEIARKYPQYKALGQKMADGINMILSAVKQMKAESIKASRPGVKTEFAADKRTTAGALRKALKAKGITSADDLEWHGISPNDPDSTPYWLYEDGSMEKIKSARPGAKTEFAASDIIVKENAQYIYYNPEDDARATFPDDNGKGAYTVKSNRTGKPVSAKTYRSIQEAAAASNEMNEKLPPLKKAKASRPGAKAKFAKPQFRTKKLHNGYIAVEVNQGSGWERYDTTHEESWNGIEEYERGYQKAYDRGLRYSGGAWRIPSTTAARPGVKAKMAASFEDRQRAAGYKWQVRYTKQLGKTDSDNAMEIDETLAFATESAARKWADTMIKKGWYKGTSGTPEKVLTAKVVPFARSGVKAKA